MNTNSVVIKNLPDEMGFAQITEQAKRLFGNDVVLEREDMVSARVLQEMIPCGTRIIQEQYRITAGKAECGGSDVHVGDLVEVWVRKVKKAWTIDRESKIKVRVWDGTRMHDYNSVYCTSKSLGELLNGDGKVAMLYTGLNDIRGTEIYEGDIVYCQHDVGEVPYTQEIRFRGGGFCVGGRDFICNFHIVEVAGNVYENKEILNIELPNWVT